MPATIEHERDNIYRVEINGTLTKTDLDRSQDALLAGLGRASVRSIRLLVVLDGFRGWDSQGDWGDLTFYATHGDSIEKIAIVGDVRWRDHALMFAAAGLRKAPVEFFPPESIAEARRWLSG